MLDTIVIENNSIVSVEELNKILNSVKHNRNLEITFSNLITKIDIVFIAGLILLGKQNQIMFRIKFSKSFPRIFEIRQYLMQFQKLYRADWKKVFSGFTWISTLSEEDFKASESFAPVVIVNRETIEKFFVNVESSNSGRAINNLAVKYRESKLRYRNKNNEEKKYFESKTAIHKVLEKYPPIYSFVFCVLYNKIDPFVNSRAKQIENPEKRIYELWEFTIEYVKGLHELAKNIVEHSSTGRGIITIRAYESNKVGELDNSGKVLETHVFDYGTRGIIPSLILFTRGNQSRNNLYADDLKILEKSYSIKDFIKPTSDRLLQQQIHREIAHYGLMRFNRLIEKNEGNVICSSIGIDGNREQYQYRDVVFEKSIQKGTSYYFELPFKPNLFIGSSSSTLYPELTGSLETIGGLKELLNLVLLDAKSLGSMQVKPNAGVIVEYMLEETVRNRADEDAVLLKIMDTIGKHSISYLALNMKLTSISDSSLIRLLALLSICSPQSIIVYNLNYEVYESMIEYYRQFYELIRSLREDIPFWNEDKGILFYTQITDPIFNFADVLYGRTVVEYENINYIVSHTFPNAQSMTQQLSEKLKDYVIPQALSPFFYQASLLAFDVLLENETGKTIFQSNLQVVVNQELRVSAPINQSHYE